MARGFLLRPTLVIGQRSWRFQVVTNAFKFATCCHYTYLTNSANVHKQHLNNHLKTIVGVLFT